MTLVLMLRNAQGKQRPKKRWLSWAEKTPGLPKEIGGVQSRLSNLKKPKLLQFYKEVFSTVKGRIHLLDVQLGRLFTAQRHLQRKIMVAKIQLVLCSLSCMP